MKIRDHSELFKQQDYQEQFERKKEFENPWPVEKVKEISDWTKTEAYKELNFKRENIKINPAKACQPLGAVFCASGFEGTMPFVQGAQGCVAYFRSHLSRHFKEPFAAISTSMTEDAAVFGGLNNMLEGLENTNALYKPKMIAVSTTCMAEVIGDDLNAYIKTAKEKGVVPEDLLIPFANTPSFVGSHIVGYDNMLKGILKALWAGKKGEANGKINIIPGFDTYTGNYHEIKRLMSLMGIEATVLADVSDIFDSPNTGEYKLYPGGTPLADAMDAVNATATVALQKYSTMKTADYIQKEWGQKTLTLSPIGIRNTDAFFAELSKITGKQIPAAIEAERGRVVDAMVDSHPYVHGKRFALVGDGHPARYDEPHHGDGRGTGACGLYQRGQAFRGRGKRTAGFFPLWRERNGLRGQGHVAPSFAVVHRSRGCSDRQLVCKVPDAGHGHAAGAHRVSALRPASSSPPADHRIPGRAESGDHAGEHDAGRAGPQDRGVGEL
jgi:nitrogenase molybdenum-iron protein beta chain